VITVTNPISLPTVLTVSSDLRITVPSGPKIEKYVPVEYRKEEITAQSKKTYQGNKINTDRTKNIYCNKNNRES
jgi:hypothetical protein